jgi:DNA-binding transcriptional ArsR family regulator
MIETGPQKGLNLSTPFSMDKGPKMKVELDKKALFALASDSRMEILKELNPQRRTVTQLAEALDIDKGAVHRHLKKLEEGGLVTRYEDHGFVYYGLSWKARDIISPGENTKIVITFAVSVVLALSAIGAVFLGYAPTGQRYSEAGQNDPVSASNATKYLSGGTVNGDWIALAVVLGIVAAILAYLVIRWMRRPKQALGAEVAEAPPPTSG